MNDQIVQLVRTLTQVGWGAVFGLTIVDQAIRQIGLDPEWTKGIAVTISAAIVVAVSQRIPNAGRVWVVIQTILNGINRAPAYQPPTQ